MCVVVRWQREQEDDRDIFLMAEGVQESGGRLTSTAAEGFCGLSEGHTTEWVSRESWLRQEALRGREHAGCG